MKASEWLRTLPPGLSPDRDAMVMEQINAGNIIPPDWYPITSNARGHAAIIYVSADTLRVGEPGDSCRIMVTATMAQEICDLLGFIMPTPAICDLIHRQAAVVVEPYLTAPDSHMADTDRIRDVNAEIDRRIAGRTGIASSFHKDWVLAKALLQVPNSAANYGFFSKAARDVSRGGQTLYQTLGTRHNRQHQDYSQQFRCILGKMSVDNVEMSVADVLMSSELADLVSDEGPLSFCRQPGVVAPTRASV